MLPEVTIFGVSHRFSLWHLWLLSICRRWLLQAVLLLVTDVDISARSTLVAVFFPCILASSKLCILGLGTWTFPEVTVFDVICFFLELLVVSGVLVLKGPLFALKSDYLSIEATCLLILSALLSHSTFTKPNQYDAAWLINILGTSLFIT